MKSPSQATKLAIRKNILLSQYSNYKIGGRARYFFKARSAEEIKEAILWAKSNKQKYFILGGGTNLLISDQGYRGLVIKIDIQHLTSDNLRIHVGAGVLMKDLLNFAAKKKLSGLEWAGGLPGTLGGAIRGNAGAFVGEIKDSVESIEYLDAKKLKTLKCSRKKCSFAYRDSVFKNKKGKSVILAATLHLKKGNAKEIKRLTTEKIKHREARQPLEYPNIGSIFKNVEVKKVPKTFREQFSHKIKTDPFPVMPSAVIIAAAGLKGIKAHGAEVSEKHSNFIVNVNNAKAKDVKALIRRIKAKVYQKFKIKLEEEVQFL